MMPKLILFIRCVKLFKIMSWVALGALILGGLLLKSLFDSDTKIYRCPHCNLVIKMNTTNCPRCGNPIGW